MSCEMFVDLLLFSLAILLSTLLYNIPYHAIDIHTKKYKIKMRAREKMNFGTRRKKE
jgi:hypothetical protein